MVPGQNISTPAALDSAAASLPIISLSHVLLRDWPEPGIAEGGCSTRVATSTVSAPSVCQHGAISGLLNGSATWLHHLCRCQESAWYPL